jgi:hypothetical protein
MESDRVISTRQPPQSAVSVPTTTSHAMLKQGMDANRSAIRIIHPSSPSDIPCPDTSKNKNIDGQINRKRMTRPPLG